LQVAGAECGGVPPLKLIYRQTSRRALLIGVTVLTPLLILLGALEWGLVESFIVTSESMAPTLSRFDRVIVDRRTGYLPRRGDLVTFPNPADAARPRFVKRIIGLEGDEIAIRGQQLYRNGEPLEESAYLRESARLIDRPDFSLTVPPGHFFAAGDHRNASFDSFDFGPVANGEIDGRVVFIYWPPGRFGRLMRPVP
jgi:signal peptidase I